MKFTPKMMVYVTTIIIIAIICLASVNLLAGGVDTLTKPKYTVHIYGNVHYDAVTGWSVGDINYEKEREGLLDLLWFKMPWETGDVLVEGTLKGGNKTYKASTWIGRLNVIYSNREFALDFKHVIPGTYTLTVKVYEADKGMIRVSNKVLQASKVVNNIIV